MVIETRRLLLRPWEDADAAALYRLAHDPVIGEAAGWPAHTSEAMSLDVIRTVLRGDEQYAITLRQPKARAAAGTSGGSELVGAIGLRDAAASAVAISPTDYEAGYWIGRPSWGRGLAPEALGALIAHARDDLGCTAIWANHYLGNERSHRVMEKCGLVYVRCARGVPVPLLGEVRDAIVMRLDLARTGGKGNASERAAEAH